MNVIIMFITKIVKILAITTKKVRRMRKKITWGSDEIRIIMCLCTIIPI